MLGKRLVTKQTGPEGKVVSKVLIAERKYIRREMYLSIVLDRKSCGPVLLGSAKGGMDIETVAHEDPSAIVREPIDINTGLLPEQAQRIAEKLGFSHRRVGAVCSIQPCQAY
jgi:succinyl-CoA synthetase beta subunit